MTDRQISAPIDRVALEELVREAMASGVVWFVDNANNIDRTKSMTEVFGDWPSKFLEIRTDLVEALS